MGIYFYLLNIFLFAGIDVSGLIIPEELPSILSLVFANIPPVKKGTDSRIGLGFRLGEHADFQTIVELGPQKETEPIGEGESKRRRQIVLDEVVGKNSQPWNKSAAKFLSDTSIVNDPEKKPLEGNWLFKWIKEVEKTKSHRISLGQHPMIQKLRVNTGDRT